MTGCDLNNGHITEQSEALEKMGAERPEVLVLLKSEPFGATASWGHLS